MLCGLLRVLYGLLLSLMMSYPGECDSRLAADEMEGRERGLEFCFFGFSGLMARSLASRCIRSDDFCKYQVTRADVLLT